MSAVSKSVIPSSSARWTTARDCSASMRMPKLLQPSPASETCSPEFPSLRYSMITSRFIWVDAAGFCSVAPPHLRHSRDFLPTSARLSFSHGSRCNLIFSNTLANSGAIEFTRLHAHLTVPLNSCDELVLDRLYPE